LDPDRAAVDGSAIDPAVDPAAAVADLVALAVDRGDLVQEVVVRDAHEDDRADGEVLCGARRERHQVAVVDLRLHRVAARAHPHRLAPAQRFLRVLRPAHRLRRAAASARTSALPPRISISGPTIHAGAHHRVGTALRIAIQAYATISTPKARKNTPSQASFGSHRSVGRSIAREVPCAQHAADGILLHRSMATRRSEGPVLVLGAGAAGLVAARDLAAAGVPVRVLEARDRAGGRVCTLPLPGHPSGIELGAEFVRGHAPQTRALAEAAGFALCDVPDTHWLATGRGIEAVGDFWQQMARATLAVASGLRRDVPFAEALRRSRLGGMRARLLRHFVAGYHAADLQQVSTHWLRDSVGDAVDEPPPQFRLTCGYGALVEALRASLVALGGTMHLGTRVEAVRWRRGRGTVHCRCGPGERAEIGRA